jgi:putative ABC transport system permease protein
VISCAKALLARVMTSGVALAGVALGTLLLYLVLVIVSRVMDAEFGLHLPVEPLDAREALALAIMVATGLVAGLLPGARAYCMSLADGIIVQT